MTADAADRLDRDRLVDEAIAATGENDLGEPTWQEGLDLLLDGFANEARLNELGVEIAAGDVVAYLTNRLAITAWRRDHPEVADGTVERPIVIVGQPRTGTTILYDLLAQDPGLRAPLTWEVDQPVPPPETATYDTDPRIDEAQAHARRWPTCSSPGSRASTRWAPASPRSACGSPAATSAA